MPFMSRFRKPKKDDDVLEGIDAALDEDEEAVLLMPIGSRPGALLADAGVPADTPDAGTLTSADTQPADGEASQPQAMEDDLMATIQTGETAPSPGPEPSDAGAASDLVNDASEAQPLDAGGTQVQTVKIDEESSGVNMDDLLSAFRDDATTGHASALTAGLEDVPMRELLTGLREVRSLLGSPVASEDEGAEEDGQE